MLQATKVKLVLSANIRVDALFIIALRSFTSTRDKIATVTQGPELDLLVNGISFKKLGSGKCLGVESDEFLTWDSHITSVSKKVSSSTYRSFKKD